MNVLPPSQTEADFRDAGLVANWLSDYLPIENIGTVEAFALCHQNSTKKELSEPVGVALVRLLGSRGGIVDRTKGVVAIGDMALAVSWPSQGTWDQHWILNIAGSFPRAFASSTVPS